MNIIPIILSGGSGSRLWPQSRSLYPKQFLPLTSERSMLQETVQRLNGLSNVSAPLVIANEEHRFLVAEQFRQINTSFDKIILEPEGRNTAPAVALAALKAISTGEDPLLLVLAADHSIKSTVEFHKIIEQAREAALEKKLVTFGIVPTHAETGYGYIKSATKPNDSESPASPVEEFVEKPDLETAEEYLLSGDYFWNSGMFMFKASQYLDELGKYRPDILTACQQAMSGQAHDLDFIRPEKTAFLSCPSESIDYAVMEKTSDAVVVPLDAGWSDVGSWSSLWAISDKDDAGNSVHGDVLLHDTKSTYVRSESKLIATIGVKDLVISESDDAILVAHKDRVQDVKKIVEQLNLSQRPEARQHRKIYRPWGAYDSIDEGERFQVKRITVKPGAKLSLQKHYHRAEHWIVVKGTALVTIGEKQVLLTENQSTYIPIGEIHRLENPGQFDLELIEVQSGSYLGEDDIVRLDDNYGRS